MKSSNEHLVYLGCFPLLKCPFISIFPWVLNKMKWISITCLWQKHVYLYFSKCILYLIFRYSVATSMEMDDVLLCKINRLHLNIRVCRIIQVKWWLLSRSHRNCSLSKSLNKFKQDYFSPPIFYTTHYKGHKIVFTGKRLQKMVSFSFLLAVWTLRTRLLY